VVNNNDNNHQRLRKPRTVPPPIANNLSVLDSPSSSVRRALSSNDSNESDEDFQLVKNKEQKKRQKQNKKSKPDPQNVKTPAAVAPSASTTTSSSASSFDNSTSSSNTSSDVLPGYKSIPNEPIKPNNPIDISQQARRFAETRYAFPPFIIKFNQQVDEQTIIKFILNHFANAYNVDLNLAGHRLKEKQELILFVNNRESFLMLYDDQKWPATINSLEYNKICPNRLPPQFSIVLRNVPFDMEVNELLTDIKNDYPDVLFANRLINKNNQPTSFVRLDIKNIDLIDNLIGKKFIYCKNLRLAITEYMAPARVLICNKCFQIGHFRSTCKSTLDSCKLCGVMVKDIKKHVETCSKKLCCVRCKGEHAANDIKCPAVKDYRAELTKTLLSQHNAPQNQSTSQQQDGRVAPVNYNENDSPILNANHQSNQFGNNPLGKNNYTKNNDKRIDELCTKMNKINDNVTHLLELNNNAVSQNTRTLQTLMKHEHQVQLLQVDTSLQREYTNQFLSPICQMIVDIVPMLVKQNMINDKTILCPSLTALCDKLTNDVSFWTSKFHQNENIKLKLINEFNMINQLPPASTSTNYAHLPPAYQ
jgi:hypothetical protein